MLYVYFNYRTTVSNFYKILRQNSNDLQLNFVKVGSEKICTISMICLYILIPLFIYYLGKLWELWFGALKDFFQGSLFYHFEMVANAWSTPLCMYILLQKLHFSTSKRFFKSKQQIKSEYQRVPFYLDIFYWNLVFCCLLAAFRHCLKILRRHPNLNKF